MNTFKTLSLKFLDFLMLFSIVSFFSCRVPAHDTGNSCRQVADTIGFASKPEQMDTVMARIERRFGDYIRKGSELDNQTDSHAWKALICPHDDYAYASYLYPLGLKNIKAKTVIMLGVAHKARTFNLEDRLVFDSFECWESAYGKTKESNLRDDLLEKLNPEYYIVHDSMHIVEHSLEAIVPFLQYYNPSVEIVPVLVPYMSLERTCEIAADFAGVLDDLATEQNLNWGKDFAIVISSDAVHYGDREWGGSNYAFYGADSVGYIQAIAHEHEIIENCLTGEVTEERVSLFTNYTLDPDDYRQYRWTWCGRYSIPMGLMIGLNLSRKQDTCFEGTLLAYSTTIAEQNPDFTDIGMGVTAPAGIHHWVGFSAIAY